MEYFVNFHGWNSIFAVPSSVVDNYIKLASGAALKVLLFVLRNNGKPLGKSFIASSLGISEENVEEAFCFWEQVNILAKDNLQTSDKQPDTPPAAPPPVESKTPSFTQRSSANFLTSPSEIAARIDNSDKIKILLSMAEKSLGNMLTYTEQRSLIWIYEYVGLDVDVILMLLEYCISIGKPNMRYVETLAISWQENNINTLDSAQAEIKRLQESRSFESKLMNIFGVSSKFSKKQKQFAADWLEKGYSTELIEYAYEKTMDSISKLSFPYIDTILKSWYANGLLTKTQIDEYDKPDSSFSSKKKKSSDQQSYDLNDLDSLAINIRKGD